MRKKLLNTWVFLALVLSACAYNGPYTSTISPGFVGINSDDSGSTGTRVSARVYTSSFLWMDWGGHNTLARQANDKLITKCPGGKLDNVTMDVNDFNLFGIYDRKTLRVTANCFLVQETQ